MSERTLEFEGISKRFGEVKVLSDVSGSLALGKVTALIGPNGAGKTTLFQVLTGEIQPDSGTVRWNGLNLVGKSPAQVSQRGIGKLFQDVRVFRHLSVLDNVVAALCAKKKSKWPLADLLHSSGSGELRQQAAELIERVGVNARPTAMAKDLSFGNQKLLAFARLLAGNYQCILLDEPIAGVSPATAQRLAELIRRMVSEDSMTVAIIEHEMSFVEELAEYVFVLSQGQIVGRGEASDVLADSATKEICLGL
jgi:ABC-type branched-subunit amino acid transport system ATPase component